MPVRLHLDEGRVPVEVYTSEVDPKTLEQLTNIASLPIVHSHVAAMPDVHFGIGATVGSVIPTRGAIIPAAVGVDIGCGMNAVRLSLRAEDLPDTLKRLRSAVEKAVPVGFAEHREPSVRADNVRRVQQSLQPLVERHPGITKMMRSFERTMARQIGTLGGGNHFIELCLDEADRVWVMLHSGSRGIGNAIGRYFIALAKKDMLKHLSNLPDANLAYFSEGAEHFDDYVAAVQWAQDYAHYNRAHMLRLVLDAMRPLLPRFETQGEAIDCHHNYVEREHHYGADVYLTRKGAIRAGKDELGIIPGSMGVRSFIVRGLGNAASFQSCAHGAGRRMSRKQARREFSVDDLARQTKGVECRKDRGVLDEIPGAYKDIDEVMANQADLVTIEHTLKQVMCVKG